jgi:amylosucrase
MMADVPGSLPATAGELLAGAESRAEALLTGVAPVAGTSFVERLRAAWPDLVAAYGAVYGRSGDIEAQLLRLVDLMASRWLARPGDLRALDAERSKRPDWFQAPDMIGYVFYVDRFAGTLRGVLDHLDYLAELGVRYVHMMPLLATREGDNDGGYAVTDYQAVRPDLGTLDDLEEVAAQLRRRGISTCIDLVINHTAAEHEWARRAAAGDQEYGAFYRIYPDRTEPDRWEATLPEVFPATAPGNFTRLPDGRWVWTTFNTWQWDLDWANPRVFFEIIRILLDLANRGIDVFRLDAVAFMWKRLGTNCQNQPEVHHLLRALRACAAIAAPAVIFKAEAIVGPDDLAPYLGVAAPGVATTARVVGAPAVPAGRECDLAYHNSLMVQFWSSLAARDTRLMTHVLAAFPHKPTRAAWGAYLRCHDDIGWAITGEDAATVSWNGAAHRAFLSEFYAGEFRGSFSRGAIFQRNPVTGDSRISGTFASLTGLEQALELGDPAAVDVAIRRILVGHALILGWDGIPLLYMGDEIGLQNDWRFLNEPAHAADNRWLHRPKMDWRGARRRHDPATVQGRIFGGIRRLVVARAGLTQLHAAAPLRVVDVGDSGLFAFVRGQSGESLLAVHNLTERPRGLDGAAFAAAGMGGLRGARDVLDPAARFGPAAPIPMLPYACRWLLTGDGRGK